MAKKKKRLNRVNDGPRSLHNCDIYSIQYTSGGGGHPKIVKIDMFHIIAHFFKNILLVVKCWQHHALEKNNGD